MIMIRFMQTEEAEQVLMLWQEACIEAVGSSLSDVSANQVLQSLKVYATHEKCHCIVAIHDSEMVGFATYCLLDHPIQPGYAGEIEELYVQPLADRIQIQTDLVHHAVVIPSSEITFV